MAIDDIIFDDATANDEKVSKHRFELPDQCVGAEMCGGACALARKSNVTSNATEEQA